MYCHWSKDCMNANEQCTQQRLYPLASTVHGTPKLGMDFPVISFLNYGWILITNVFCTSFCCGFWSNPWFSRAHVTDSLSKFWENSYTTSSYSLSVSQILDFSRWSRWSSICERVYRLNSVGRVFVPILIVIHIYCLWLFCQIPLYFCQTFLSLHCLLFFLFLIKSSGGDRWRGEKKTCLVLAWGPRALLWEAAWTVNGGRSHSQGDDTHVYKGMKYCSAHWCQNMKWKVWCPFGQ